MVLSHCKITFLCANIVCFQTQRTYKCHYPSRIPTSPDTLKWPLHMSPCIFVLFLLFFFFSLSRQNNLKCKLNHVSPLGTSFKGLCIIFRTQSRVLNLVYIFFLIWLLLHLCLKPHPLYNPVTPEVPVLSLKHSASSLSITFELSVLFWNCVAITSTYLRPIYLFHITQYKCHFPVNSFLDSMQIPLLNTGVMLNFLSQFYNFMFDTSPVGWGREQFLFSGTIFPAKSTK